MDFQKIDELLEKYWNADTSPEEEATLRRYFSENEVPHHLKGVAGLFRQYQADRQFKNLDPDFDTELLQNISGQRKPFAWRPLLRIAAVLTIFLLAALLLKQHLLTPQAMKPAHVAHTQVQDTTDTYQDPQLAYEQTKQALLLLSSLMNEGTQHMEELEKFSEVQETIKTEKQ